MSTEVDPDWEQMLMVRQLGLHRAAWRDGCYWNTAHNHICHQDKRCSLTDVIL